MQLVGLESMSWYNGGGFEYYKKELESIPSLKYAEEIVLLEKIRNGDSKAKERFLLTKLHFVVNFVTRAFSDSGISLEDLVQEGNISLLDAIDSYDSKMGIAFTNYAAICIYRHILRHISDNAFLIQLPVLKSELAYKVMSYKNQYKTNYGVFPPPEELCAQLDISMENYLFLEEYIDNLSFDELDVLRQRNCKFLSDDKLKNVEDIFFEKMMKLDVQELVDEYLSSFEKDIISQYIGVNDEFSTLRSLGKKYGLSHSTIAQRRQRTINHLKKIAEKKEIYAYLTDDIVDSKILEKNKTRRKV